MKCHISISLQVSVYVSDINDNAPVFPANGYSVFISEGALANQAVIGATAYDADTGNNSKLTYEIISGNNGGMLIYIISYELMHSYYLNFQNISLRKESNDFIF